MNWKTNEIILLGDQNISGRTKRSNIQNVWDFYE